MRCWRARRRIVLSLTQIDNVEELDCAEFVIQCGKRDYTFKAPSEETCTVLVHNLRQLRERAARERAARVGNVPQEAEAGRRR